MFCGSDTGWTEKKRVRKNCVLFQLRVIVVCHHWWQLGFVISVIWLFRPFPRIFRTCRSREVTTWIRCISQVAKEKKSDAPDKGALMHQETGMKSEGSKLDCLRRPLSRDEVLKGFERATWEVHRIQRSRFCDFPASKQELRVKFEWSLPRLANRACWRCLIFLSLFAQIADVLMSAADYVDWLLSFFFFEGLLNT